MSKETAEWVKSFGLAMVLLTDVVGLPLAGAGLGWLARQYWGVGPGWMLLGAVVGLTMAFAHLWLLWKKQPK